MIRTGPADAVVSAYSRAAPGWAVPARPGSRELLSARPASRPPASGAPFPGAATLKPASGRLAGRSGRSRPACLLLRQQQRVRAPHPPGPRPPAPADPLYLYLLKWHPVPLFGSSFDPGRDTLCMLTSPPPWLQWP